ncbi:hypothetical protein Micbo1qcDRAFT_155336, partial [Microdochium bolleyi]
MLGADLGRPRIVSRQSPRWAVEAAWKPTGAAAMPASKVPPPLCSSPYAQAAGTCSFTRSDSPQP